MVKFRFSDGPNLAGDSPLPMIFCSKNRKNEGIRGEF